MLIPIPDSNAFRKRLTGRATQCVEPVLGFEPKREIEIAALVPDLDLLAAEVGKARNLFPQRPRDRADHGYGRTSSNRVQAIGHHIRRHAKLPLALQQVTVLLGDLATAHGFPERRDMSKQLEAFG